MKYSRWPVPDTAQHALEFKPPALGREVVVGHGLESLLAVRGEHRTAARIEERIVLEHLHSSHDCVETRAAALEDDETGAQRRLDSVAKRALPVGHEFCRRKRSCPTVDGDREQRFSLASAGRMLEQLRVGV
jgi:hypothetical protein